MAPHIGEKAQINTEPPVDNSAQVVAVGASPFTYTAPRNGMLFLSGGTLSAIQYIRGASVILLNLTANQIMVMKGDQVRITYLTAPSLTFLPTI